MTAVASPRLPSWARRPVGPLAPQARPLRLLLREQRLVTVCEEARCPNLPDCFGRGTATFMLLGDRCTRRCGYCAVSTARPAAPDPAEPGRISELAVRMGLRYVVLTAVARDDLRDGGAEHFAATVEAIRDRAPSVRIEVLTPDFKGRWESTRRVVSARPDVFNHNVETVSRLFPRVRPQGSYRRSLDLLAGVKRARPDQVTKSGLMIGLGETDAEVEEVLGDLREARVDVVTLGQYLRPSRDHLPVARYLPPSGFEHLAERARSLGFPAVYSGVFVRSSFNAEEVYESGARTGGPRALS